MLRKVTVYPVDAKLCPSADDVVLGFCLLKPDGSPLRKQTETKGVAASNYTPLSAWPSGPLKGLAVWSTA